jgi:hypothetical protein
MSETTFKTGDRLEFNAAAYFQAQGFLVRRGVVLSVAAGTADATDIDLLAIRFTVPLSEERVVADCKDRRKPRPFERILWTRGLASFADATQAVVVLPKTGWQAREFAARGKVDVLEAGEIQKYLKSINSAIRPYGDADPKHSERRRHITDKQLARLSLEMRQMLVSGHPLTNLNRLIQIISTVGKQSGSENQILARKYICFDAAVIASVMLVRFAAECKWTPEKDWTAYGRKKLTFGDVSPQKALQLAELALDRRISEGIPAPAYTREILDVIKVLIANPQIAARVPTSLDHYLFGDRRPDLSNDPLYERSLSLSRRVLSALSYAAGIGRTVLEVQSRQKEFYATPQTAAVLESRNDVHRVEAIQPGTSSVEEESDNSRSAGEEPRSHVATKS